MNLSTLEQIVGPIKRGQLAVGFNPDYSMLSEKEPTYLNDNDTKPKPPPLTEDLSHLNDSKTKKYSKIAKGLWKRLTPAERRERKRHLAAAGKLGGAATKDMRHLHW